MDKRDIYDLTLDECEDIWILIGGSPHLFSEEIVRNWIVDGELEEGLLISAREMYVVVNYLIKSNFDLE